MSYLCANFGLPRPLCSRLRPDVRDRQTDVRQKHRLMPPPIRGGGIITHTQEGTDRRAVEKKPFCYTLSGVDKITADRVAIHNVNLRCDLAKAA